MVKHNCGKKYTPLVWPVFVELGIEQYHSLYKNWQYQGIGSINMFGSKEGVKDTPLEFNTAVQPVEHDEQFYLMQCEQECGGQALMDWIRQAYYLNLVTLLNYFISVVFIISAFLVDKYSHTLGVYMVTLESDKHVPSTHGLDR